MTTSPPPLCDIVIPIWNQPELTQRCLRSVAENTQEPIRLILIDNGSEPPTQRMLEQFRSNTPIPMTLLRNPTNLGFIKAVNQGVRAATAEWVVLLNNDTVATAGWLTEMLQVASSNPKIGLVNPTSNSLGFHAGNQSLTEYAAALKKETGRWTNLSTALGFCLLARRSLVDRIGLLDESFGMGYFEDDDLSKRVQAAGFLCARACAAYVYHEERGSFRHLPGAQEAFQKNRGRFEARWGRRLRILWSLYGVNQAIGLPASSQTETAALLASQGHWITLIASDHAVPPKLRAQAQLALLAAPAGRWRWKATWRLVTKRKKPYDLVISYDPAWSRCLNRLRWLHRAQLLENPSPEKILALCRNERSPM